VNFWAKPSIDKNEFFEDLARSIQHEYRGAEYEYEIGKPKYGDANVIASRSKITLL
jgi:hypothetical protein